MSDVATTARENASHCEAKKHALRQTQDGIVVAFVLHPNDVPAALQLAPLGTRYMLALVEIGEDEQPKQQEGTIAATTASHRTRESEPAPESPHTHPAPVRALRNYAQQAGILCSKSRFWLFARENGGNAVKDAESAAVYVRRICDVETRADIKSGTPAENRWLLLQSSFIAWDNAVRAGAA